MKYFIFLFFSVLLYSENVKYYNFKKPPLYINNSNNTNLYEEINNDVKSVFNPKKNIIIKVSDKQLMSFKEDKEYSNVKTVYENLIKYGELNSFNLRNYDWLKLYFLLYINNSKEFFLKYKYNIINRFMYEIEDCNMENNDIYKILINEKWKKINKLEKVLKKENCD